MLGFYHAKRTKRTKGDTVPSQQLPSNFEKLIREAEQANVASGIISAARKALQEQQQQMALAEPPTLRGKRSDGAFGADGGGGTANEPANRTSRVSFIKTRSVR